MKRIRYKAYKVMFAMTTAIVNILIVLKTSLSASTEPEHSLSWILPAQNRIH